MTACFRRYNKDGTDHVVVQVDPCSKPSPSPNPTPSSSTPSPYFSPYLPISPEQVDPFSKPPPAAAQLEEFQLLQVAERECINEVREADRQTKDLLRKREEEEASIAETMAGGPVATGAKESKVPPRVEP